MDDLFGRPDNRFMRYPRDRSPDEREATILAVRSAVQDIDRRDKSSVEAQLAAFLCAAWPTLEAQSQ